MQSGEAKEEVRSRLNIEDVIGEYVPLKRAGRSFKGLSPFNEEKTASFFVSPDKQIWHDFSSNKGGDIFSFIMEVEGLDFRGALELLARKAGVDLSLYQSAGSGNFTKKKQRLLDICEQAAIFYQRALFDNKTAIEYVSKKRGLNRQVVHDFRIGYAPSSGSELQKYLLSKGFKTQEIKDAGLIGSRGSDLFRERMMVPLMDSQGQVIGFTARLIRDIKNAPKYINTPQTLLYDKSRHVFGLSQAKDTIRQQDYAVLVEGNLDVISAHQAGTTHVVATAGTALTEYHLKALSRLTSHVRLCFDGDKAGVAATERAIPIAEKAGVELGMISLPAEFKDPDEIIQSDIKQWQQLIEQPQPAVEWIISQYKDSFDLTTAAGKRGLSSKVLEIIRLLRDPVEQEHYINLLSEATGASSEALKSKLSRQFAAKDEKTYKPTKIDSVSSQDYEVHQDYLLGLAVIDPSVHDVLRHLAAEVVSDDRRRQLLAYILDHRGKAIVEPFPEELQSIETYVKIVTFKAETRYAAVDNNDRLVEAAQLVQRVQKEQRNRIKKQLDNALRDAEARGDEATAHDVRRQLNALIKEMKRAKR